MLADLGGTGIDFSAIGMIRGVEAIDMDDGLDQMLQLGYDDVFNATDAHNVLVLNGDSIDDIRLGSGEGWHQVDRDGSGGIDGADTVTLGGGTYNVWESSDNVWESSDNGSGETVTLLIDAAINNVSDM